MKCGGELNYTSYINKHIESTFRGWLYQKALFMMHMFLGKMLILAGLLKLAKPKPLAPAAGSPAT